MPDDLRELDRELAALLEPKPVVLDKWATNVSPGRWWKHRYNNMSGPEEGNEWVPAYSLASDPSGCHLLKLEMVRRGYQWETGTNLAALNSQSYVYARILDKDLDLVSCETGNTEMIAFAKAARAALKGAANG